jgi:hypothetical protein
MRQNNYLGLVVAVVGGGGENEWFTLIEYVEAAKQEGRPTRPDVRLR